jgi:hypothetical protein
VTRLSTSTLLALPGGGCAVRYHASVPFVSSDPDAWMRPYCEVVASRDRFALLPIPIQFVALIDAIAVDHPAKAAKVCEIDDLPCQRALLGSFTRIVFPRPEQHEIELWRAVKDERELRCIALPAHRDRTCG